MSKNGMPIDQAPLRGAISSGISYSMKYLEYEACISAGLDIQRWRIGGYPKWLMADIVAWYDLKHAIRNHQESARNRAK